ncbi:K02A2.6-like, partial [Cordylochernes scorpioides]
MLQKKEECMRAKTSGQFKGRQCNLNEVIFVPELSKNLLSVSSIVNNGGEVNFKGDKVTILKDGKKVLEGDQLENGLYAVNIEQHFSKQNDSNLTLPSENKTQEWHRKLGHIGMQNLRKLESLVDGMELNKLEKQENDVCEICIMAKQTRKSFGNERSRATRPLEIVHTDLCGPIEPLTHDNKKYIMTFLDDYTHFCYVYLLSNKYEAKEYIKEYVNEVERFLNAKVSKLRCDNGGEYANTQVKEWCKMKGIILDFTIPYTPQLNGKAERLNRTLIEKTRALLLDSKLNKEMWGEATRVAAYLINRSPSNTVQTTPAQMWFGRKPNLSNVKLFGSEVYVKKLGNLKKIGYSENGYRLWDMQKRRFIIARDVVFTVKLTNEMTSVIQPRYREDLDSEIEESQDTKMELDTHDKLLRVQARILTRLTAPVWRREPAETGSRQFVLVSAASGGLTPRLAVCVWCSPYVPALVINKTGTKGAPTTQSGLLTKQRAQHNMVAAAGSLRSQRPEETIEEFVTVLHRISEHCEYANLREELIRDRLVLGVKDRKLSEKLMLNENLTLAKAVEIARQWEAVMREQQDLNPSTSQVDTTRKVAKQKPKASGHGKDNGRSTSRQTDSAKETDEGKKFQLALTVGLPNIIIVTEISAPLRTKSVERAGKRAITLISVEEKTMSNVQLTPTDGQLMAAANQRLENAGTFVAKLRANTREMKETVYVVHHLEQPLLGVGACEDLQLVKRIDLVINGTTDVNPEREFPKLFEGLGLLEQPYHIKLKEGAEPFSIPVPRRVPLPLMPKLKEQLDAMVAQEVIEPVEPTEWCAPIVLAGKPNGKIRICVDLSRLNLSVERELHPLPVLEHELAQLNGAKIFSRLDANSGFWQIKLSEESQTLTTFITPFGRYQFKRLPFGISSAPEHFQKRMSAILRGVNGVICHMDDILIFAKRKEEHDETLREVLRRLKNSGITLNKEKCQFGVSNVTFLGHYIDEHGIKADEKKVKAIAEMKPPTDVHGVQRFMGMVNFLGRFVPNLAEITKPLNDLRKKDVSFIWGSPQKKAFEKVKDLLASDRVLASFDISKKTMVSADASSYGLGAVLKQEHEANEWRPVAFASRTLTKTEQGYAQIEKEALAITWACERFKDFVVGKPFLIETDHKPLDPIFTTKDLNDLTPRLQRYRMRMLQFSFHIFHTPGKDLITADALSRQPLPGHLPEDEELQEEVKHFVRSIVLHQSTTDDRLAKIALNQKLEPTLQNVAFYSKNGWPAKCQLSPLERSFYDVRDEIGEENGLLMRGLRVIIPSNMRKDVLNRIHAGHQGITKCRARAKDHVWWPGIGQEIQDMVKTCEKCIENQPLKHEPLIPNDFPERPWQKVGMDLFHYEGILALMEYRATPLANGLSPAELLFGRKIRTMVPCTSSSLTPKTVDQSKLRGEEEQRKMAQKTAFDRRHAATKKAELIAGEKVWVKDLRAWGSVLEKASAPRSYIVETPVGTYRRNSLLLASSQQQVDPSETSPDSELPTEAEETPGNELPAEELQQLPAIAPEIKQLSPSPGKVSRPKRLKDYEVLNSVSEEIGLLTYNEAVTGVNKENWVKAIQEEKDSLKKNETWDFVNAEEVNGNKILSSRWIFKIKDGGHYKARLVARGNEQKGLDFDETFSPVVSTISLRMFLFLSVKKNLKFKTFDVKTAFLYGYLDEEIFMYLPEGYEDNKICRLKKALYGLRQAPSKWNKRFEAFLKTKGLVKSKLENCIFKNQNGSLILALYVDDGMLFGSGEEEMDNLLEELAQEFEIRISNNPEMFVGMNIMNKDEGLILSQHDYIKCVLKKYNMLDAKPVTTPIVEGAVKIDPILDNKSEDNCPAHQIPEELQNIEIRFFPSLTTSALQPCDMGIIKALKDQYRKRMISYHLLGRNAQVHLLFSISWLEAAWVGVSSSTIKNCFSHSGFVIDKAMEEVVEEEMNRCFEALKQHQAIDVNYIDFLEVDKDVQVTGEQSIEEIVKEIMGKEEDEEVEPTEKDLNKTSITSAVDAINTIKTLCFLKDISEEDMH